MMMLSFIPLEILKLVLTTSVLLMSSNNCISSVTQVAVSKQPAAVHVVAAVKDNTVVLGRGKMENGEYRILWSGRDDF